MSTRGGHRSRISSEEKDLAKLKGKWATHYLILEPRPRWWFWRQWEARRKGIRRDPLIASTAAGLESAIELDWWAEKAHEANTRAAEAEAARAARNASEVAW